MARLLGPDEGSRLVYRTSGSTLQRAVGASVEVFSDAGATTPADILTVGGATIVGSAVLTDAYSRIPLFQFPDGADTVYVVISGGPITAVYARSDDRIDANTALLVGHTAALAALPGTYGLVQEALTPKPSAAPSGAAPTMIAHTAAAGHGWVSSTVEAGATHSLNDTADFMLGSQSIKVATAGTGAANRLQKTGLTLDMTAKQPVLWVKVDDVTKLSLINVYLGDNGLANYFRFDFEANVAASTGDRYLRSGVWHRMTVDWSSLSGTGQGFTSGAPNRAALTTIQVTIQDIGGGAGNATNIHIGGVGSIPEPTLLWPNGVWCPTFDDGYIDQMFVQATLDKYAYPATYFPIWQLLGTDGANFMTVAQLLNIQDAHGGEVGAHAFLDATHSGVGGLTALSSVAQNADLLANKRALIAAGFRGHDMYAYPQGLYNDTVIGNVKQYHAAARSHHVFHRETFPPAEPYRIRTLNFGATLTLAAAKLCVDECAAGKAMLVTTGHRFSVGAAVGGSQWQQSNFASLVDYVATKGMAVRCLGDVLRRAA